MARYAPGQPPYTEDINQLERYLRVEHEQVRGSTDDIYTLAEFSLEHFVAEAYLELAALVAYPLTLSATWQPMPWDAVALNGNKAVAPNLPFGMNFIDDAIWRCSVVADMTFDEVNAGRTIKFRLYNTTTASANGTELWFAVGRNTPGFTATMSWLAGVHVDVLSQNVQLQISSADAFTNLTVRRASWAVNSVSRYQGANPVTSLEKQGK